MSFMIGGLASRQVTIGTPVALFTMPIDPSGFGARSQFVVSNDGQRFLMPIAIERRTPPTLVVISNWRPPS